jgi:hypothetical protein
MNRRVWVPVFFLLAFIFGACGVNINLNVDRGSGNVITQTRSVGNFDKVVLNGIGDITVTQGNTESLQIEAEDNILPLIKTVVTNGTLDISFDKKAILPTKPVKFMLAMRNIHALQTNGVSNIHSEKINTNQLDIGISGTGNINIQDLTADQVTVNVSGAGNLTAVGKVSSQKVTLSGAGNYDGQDLQSKSADITISGLGKVTSWVTDNLSIIISGTGGVDYYGSPQVSQQISGLGRINHLGNK